MPKKMAADNLAALGRQEACEALRAKHPAFVYESFAARCSGGALRLQFHFRIPPGIEFAPEIVIEQIDPERVESLPAGVLENLAFHLGLIEMLSYWKATCSPRIVVRAGALDAEQAAWWLDLLAHGMGEFFYVNRIAFREDFVGIVAEAGKERRRSRGQEAKSRAPELQNRDLVLTSGGKDSVVTLEILRRAGRQFDCLLLNPTPAALAVARQSQCASLIVVRRTIDPRLLELNAAGYLNGHTPFSALLAFLGAAVAATAGCSRVIVSNERSAEEAAAEFLGREVNHQYSKSFRFETLFRQYARKYLAPPAEYFSLLRPLYELQIARAFARHPQYFPLFRSCNRGMAANSWCGRCPKCLFVFIALYPFLRREEALAIFGEDLLSREGAEEILKALLGLGRDKPFECVGTREETLAALYLCLQKYAEQAIGLPPALRKIGQSVLSVRGDLAQIVQRVLTAWTDQHHVPPDLAGQVHQQVAEFPAPARGTDNDCAALLR